jgi:hypothetical protein
MTYKIIINKKKKKIKLKYINIKKLQTLFLVSLVLLIGPFIFLVFNFKFFFNGLFFFLDNANLALSVLLFIFNSDAKIFQPKPIIFCVVIQFVLVR